MPPKLDRCVQHLMENGHDESSAHAICNSVMEMMMEPEQVTPKAELEPEIVKEMAAGDRRRKFYVAETKALRNGDVESYISTESIDRVGDIIKAKGWDLNNFRKTGAPVLFSHDYSRPPIGKAVEIEIQRKGLWAVTRFHEKTQLSRDLAMLSRDGDMRSWSVGFNAMEPPETRTEDGVFKGYIFHKAELLEYSLVPVPANPEAVSKAIHLAHKGLISRELAAVFAGPSPSAEMDTEERITVPDQSDENDFLDAQLAGLHFLKGLLK